MALTNPITILSPKISRKLGEILIDGVLEETTRFAAAITDHPVEIPSGAVAPRGSITDHVFLLPRSFALRGVITDNPIGFRNLQAFGNSFNQTRSQAGYLLLVELLEAREPFTVRTGYQDLENMVLETLTFPKDASHANAIIFAAELREIQVARTAPIVSNRVTPAPEDVVGDQAKSQAVGVQRRGEVATPEVSVGSKAYSAAKDLFKSLTGAGGAP